MHWPLKISCVWLSICGGSSQYYRTGRIKEGDFVIHNAYESSL
jgi:hypothetical protein